MNNTGMEKYIVAAVHVYPLLSIMISIFTFSLTCNLTVGVPFILVTTYEHILDITLKEIIY